MLSTENTKQNIITSKLTEVSKLRASDASSHDYFGISTSMSEDGLTLVVGAVGKNANGLTNNGQVYTYTRNTTEDDWIEVSKLRASDAADNDWFGSEVSLSGDRLNLVVGAYGKITDGLYSIGQVYTYTRDTIRDEWVEVSKLTSNDTINYGYFGTSVSISSDGLNLAVGMYSKDTHGLINSGQVYTYTRPTINDAWVEVSKLTSSNAVSLDLFGSDVSISGNGLNLVVGAVSKNTNGLYSNGQVYTYTRDTVNSDWYEISELIVSDTDNTNNFGMSVSTFNNGLNLIVGAMGKNANESSYSGQVYTYTRDTINDEWVEVSKLTASDAVNKDYFGASVSLSNNGTTLVVGAPHKDVDELESSGQVYTYTKTNYQ